MLEPIAMALSDLHGQSRASTLLGSSLASGQVHHAYLFAGPDGVGKTLAARLVAQALNCEGPQAQEAARRGAFVDDPCGACSACRRISEDPREHKHPLVLWVDTEAAMQAQGLYSPEGDRSPTRGIGVRLLRELVIPRLSLRVMGGRRKVAIFRDVDFGEPAQNAFLKTLEEPPADTTFIILSSTPDALKPTIRSRCSRVTFQPLSVEVVAQRVADSRGVALDEARLLAALSGGSIGGALEIDEAFLKRRREIIEAFEGTAKNDYAGWLRLAEGWAQKEAGLVLDVLESWLQDLALVAAGSQAPVVNVDLVEQAQKAAGELGVVEALSHLEKLKHARWMIERNVQPRLALERLFLSFAGIEPLSLKPR